MRIVSPIYLGLSDYLETGFGERDVGVGLCAMSICQTGVREGPSSIGDKLRSCTWF